MRIVDVESVIIGELHENEMRKQFTPSERIAIFRSIETVKAGRPEKIRPLGEELIPDTEKAAKLAGFAGRGTAYRAEKVVKDGIPELVEAMDEGEDPRSSGALTFSTIVEIVPVITAFARNLTALATEPAIAVPARNATPLVPF